MAGSMLQQFLAIGRLGDIHLGMDAQSLRNLLGEPDDISLQKRPTIWKFGSVQIALQSTARDAVVNEIHVYLHQPFELPRALAWANREMHPLTMTEFVHRMRGWRLPFDKEPLLTFGNQQALRVAESAVAIFEACDEEWRLVSLHTNIRSHTASSSSLTK